MVTGFNHSGFVVQDIAIGFFFRVMVHFKLSVNAFRTSTGDIGRSCLSFPVCPEMRPLEISDV